MKENKPKKEKPKFYLFLCIKIMKQRNKKNGSINKNKALKPNDFLEGRCKKKKEERNSILVHDSCKHGRKGKGDNFFRVDKAMEIDKK